MTIAAKLAALAAALLAAGCAPTRHSIAPYDSDPAQARALEARAAGRCASLRADSAAPPYPFTTDGCSLWPDGNWVACCVEHDIEYWCGGSARARAAADRGLRECVAARGHPWIGQWMHLGTRLGGHPLLPFAWRWGYGWDWPYRYDASE